MQEDKLACYSSLEVIDLVLALRESICCFEDISFIPGVFFFEDYRRFHFHLEVYCRLSYFKILRTLKLIFQEIQIINTKDEKLFHC